MHADLFDLRLNFWKLPRGVKVAKRATSNRSQRASLPSLAPRALPAGISAATVAATASAASNSTAGD